jgi:hypothetical protein
MMNSLNLSPLLLAAAVAASACAGSNVETAAAPATGAGTTVLHVVNENPKDVNVYLLANGQTVQLANVVPGMGPQEVNLPNTLQEGTEFRLLVDPIGSVVAYLSDPLFFAKGSEYTLTVGFNLSYSSVMPVAAGR